MSGPLDPDEADYSVIADLPGGRRVTVEFCTHAIRAMRRRVATEEQVIACLRNPDLRGLDADLPKLRVCRADGTQPMRSLHVVYIPFGTDCWRVISVFWKRTGVR